MSRLRYERFAQHGFIEAIFSPHYESVNALVLVTSAGYDQRVLQKHKIESFNGRLYINSYFLDDGAHEISIIIEDSAKLREIQRIERRIEICNGSSNLAHKLRSAFRAYPNHAVIANHLDSSYFAELPGDISSINYPLETRKKARLKHLTRQQVNTFDSQGFLILESFFDRNTMTAARAAVSTVNRQQSHGFSRGSSSRIVNLHEHYPALNKIYNSSRLYDVISDLLGHHAFPCQSLTFINGSSQDAHQDTIHLTPFPRGLMCGIWIALEDVCPGSGELFYYPGSHKLPAILCSNYNIPKVDPELSDYSSFGSAYIPEINKLIEGHQLAPPTTLLAKAGDLLVWHENLIHGGSARKDLDCTRMSMVIHAFAEPAMIYYDSTGISGRRDILHTSDRVRRSRWERLLKSLGTN